ncbi:MAG: hypothetical protein KDN22_08275 [Verrucomicrobiae bacterium]|nr:hypothetical protein [Verrucomicrobiae bacterium]
MSAPAAVVLLSVSFDSSTSRYAGRISGDPIRPVTAQVRESLVSNSGGRIALQFAGSRQVIQTNEISLPLGWSVSEATFSPTDANTALHSVTFVYSGTDPGDPDEFWNFPDTPPPSEEFAFEVPARLTATAPHDVAFIGTLFGTTQNNQTIILQAPFDALVTIPEPGVGWLLVGAVMLFAQRRNRTFRKIR